MSERETRDHAAGEASIVEPPRPDPSLRRRPVRAWARWLVGIAVVFLVIFVLYALNAPAPEPQVAGSPQPAAGSSTPAPSATTGSGAK
jgi:hypothetical protein